MKNILINIQTKLLQIPLALTAIALGLTTLGIAWGQYSSTNANNLPGININGNCVQYFTIVLATIFLILCWLKVVSNPLWVWKEMKSASSSSHLPVLFMITMAVGEFVIGKTTFATSTFYFGLTLWYIGLILQLSYCGWWIITRILWFDIKDVDGAWYVPIVGIPVACAIVPTDLGGNAYITLLQVLWYVSFITFMLLTGLIFYRYLFINPIHTTELPAIGIIAAPASLLLVTYYFDFVVVNQSNPIFMFLLAGLAFSFTLLAYISMIKVFTCKFNVGMAAYSFPLAIGAVARIIFATWLSATYGNVTVNLLIIFKNEAYCELVISSLIMIYLIIGFTIHTSLKLFCHNQNNLPKILKYFE